MRLLLSSCLATCLSGHSIVLRLLKERVNFGWMVGRALLGDNSFGEWLGSLSADEIGDLIFFESIACSISSTLVFLPSFVH